MDELNAKQLPHSMEAEQAVIGSMLIDSRCVGDVLGVLKEDDFYFEANRNIFSTIYSMFNYSQVIDALTVLEKLRTDGLANENSRNYIMDLMSITPTAVNAMQYAAVVKDKALLRNIAVAGDEINNLAMEGIGRASDILEVSEQKVYALREGKANDGLKPVSQVLLDVYQHLNELAKTGTSFPGLDTGFPDINNAIMGLNNSDFILIASRPGMGKTSIALNMGMHVAKNSGKAVAVFSLEMSREQLALRLLSSECRIHNKKLQSGRLSDSEWRDIRRACSSIGSSEMLINDNPMLTVADMNAQCRRIKNLGLVIIDYLQLMQSSGSSVNYASESRTQVVSDISRMLKIMAKELNVPVIALSQLSRQNEGRTNKRPVLSDLRESGAIEQDADIVMALYRENYYKQDDDPDDDNEAECIILKNRRGETGTVKLKWLPEFTTYVSLDTIHSEDDSF